MKVRNHFLIFQLLCLIIVSCSRNVLRRVKRSSHQYRLPRNVASDGLAAPRLERTVAIVEETSFLQIDFSIYFGSRKNVAQLKACCDTVFREGISKMVQKVTEGLEQVLEARSLYLFLKETGGKFHFEIDSFCH